MDQPKLSLTVSRGLIYSYFFVPPNTDSKPFILFLHGFPSLPVDYHEQIRYMISSGYGIITPELLGYGDTSRPDKPDSYRLKLMAGDLVEILDHHLVQGVVGVGHDWGVTLLTRLEFYHPTRVTRMALLTIASSPFGQSFDLNAVNAMTKEHLGYEGFGYIAFFTEDAEAAELINTRQESFRSLVFAKDPEVWKQYLGSIGGTQKWLMKNQNQEKIHAFTDAMGREHDRAFSVDKGGYTAAIKWYVSHVSNLNIPDEQKELRERGTETYLTSKPVLQILADNDPIALAPMQKQMAEAYAPHVKTISLPTGHWVMLEASEEVNRALELFVESTGY